MFGKIKDFDKKMWNNRTYQSFMSVPRKLVHTLKRVRKYGILYPVRLLAVKTSMQGKKNVPLVSIIMPVYNVEKYLRQCLDSLLEQKVRNIEIITVDDGSTDSSLDILKEYAKKDHRLKVFTQENQYAGTARNLGLTKAAGEYVMFLDSDDFFEKEIIKDAYSVAKANRADILLFGARYYEDVTGKYREGKSFVKDHLAPPKQPFCYKDSPKYFYQLTTACPWTKIYRRAFVLETGLQFQPLRNSNDVFFVYSSLAMAKRVVTYKKPLVNYRVGMATNLQATKKKSPFCFYEAFKAWHDKLKALGVLEEVRQSYVSAALEGCLYNLRTVTDPETKKLVFDKMRNEIFRELEITGKPKAYYHDQKNYADMCLVEKGDFTQYMNEKSR